jgi:hypothetical protein
VKTRRWRTSLAVIPVATVAWLGLGTGAALAAPGGHATDSSANAAGANANDANANGGVGQGNGNGNAKHDDSSTSSDSTATTPTDTSTTSAPADASSSGTASSHQTAGTAGTAGDPTDTQPLSNADSKGGGSNGQCPGGPYCSTRHGSASGNGNGDGKAVGKPCAGCVGKADNKNPKGQNPDGSDHNKGYECDGNNGIGKTNPAHTGCTPTGTTCAAPSTVIDDVCTPPCPEGQTRVNGVCTTTSEECPQGEHLSNGTCVPDDDCVPTAANNNCTPTTPCVAPAHAGPDGTCVLGEKHTRKPGTTVLGTKTTRLPFTGASVGWMTEGGMAAVTMGTLMLVVGGRRKRSQV